MNPTNKKLIVLSLLASLAGGFTVSTRADDKPADKPADKPVDKPTEKPADKTAATTKKPFQPTQQKLLGKIVALDRIGKSCTLQINGQTYVLQLSDVTKYLQGAEQKSINDLVVGEDVSVDVLLHEGVGGRIEVSVLTVELSDATAQGRGRHGRHGHFRPFDRDEDRRHSDGPIVSPTKRKKNRDRD